MPKYPIHDRAQEQLRKITREIYDSIIIIASELAKRDKADEIQTTHIEEARHLLSPKQGQSRIREISKILGSALIGAFFPGFVTSLPTDGTPANTAGLIVYTAFGMVGLLLTFYGFR
jgi:lysozyme family protein